MNTNHQETARSQLTCDQCGLPVGSGRMTVARDERRLRFCCYGCSMTHALIGQKGEEGAAGMFLARLGFSAFLSMNIMALSWAMYDRGWVTLGMDADAQSVLAKLLFALSLPVMLFVGYPFVQNAARELQQLRLSLDALIALGSFTAFGFSSYQAFTGGAGVYFDTATMTIVLVTAGRYLEASAKLKTTSAIRQLLALQPQTARIVKEGTETIVPAAGVGPGATIKILPGERIPLDATILEGRTTVNEALLTGEARPATKRAGDTVLAATVNIDGAVTARVIAASDDTAYAHVARLLEQAQRERSPIQQLVDRVSAKFIPAVISLALGTLIAWWWVASPEVAALHALTVLVVACPCALGIGTPLATVVALGRAAEQGVLIRSTAALEKLADARVVAFDKTGTLTTGSFTVSKVQTQHDEQRFLSLVASLEKSSEHPLGKAIVGYARERGISLSDTRNVTVQPGLGIRGEVRLNGQWKMVGAGTESFLEQSSDSTVQDDQETTVHAGWDGAFKGSIVLRDAPRQAAREVIQQLHHDGMTTVLLSGDSEAVARETAEELSIQHVHGKLLPGDKLSVLQSLKAQGTVLMVGDGINDAPSLAAADVGITLGSATDIAKESADVTILGDHLEKISWLIRLARKTLGTIHWNLFWAFGYNAVGIALAVVGLLEPIMAAFAMVGSSLFIIINSRRLARTTTL